MQNEFLARSGRSAGAARPRVYFNGKFYSGALNGVHRVADRLLQQIDALAGEGALPSEWDMRVLVPRRGNWAPAFRNIGIVEQRLGHSQLWEQGILPFVASDGVLVSLANLSPICHGRKLTMVHDAQFRLSPESYPWKLRLGYRLLVPAGARTSRSVMTVSDYARDCLDTFGFAPRERISLVRNAGEHILEARPDPAIFDRLELKGQFCILFGSPAVYKNIRTVLDAFRHPALQGITLLIVGADAGRLSAGGLDLPPGAVIAGPLSDGELRYVYERALCLLFPSRTEGFGLPPLEAMICGCPVVSAPSGAMPEICRDAVLYADHSDPEQWVDAILSLAASPGLRDGKIQAGKARGSAFSWRSAGVRLSEEIAAVLAGVPARRTAA